MWKKWLRTDSYLLQTESEIIFKKKIKNQSLNLKIYFLDRFALYRWSLEQLRMLLYLQWKMTTSFHITLNVTTEVFCILQFY